MNFGGLLATELQNNWEFIWSIALGCKHEAIEVYNFWKFITLHEEIYMSANDYSAGSEVQK